MQSILRNTWRGIKVILLFFLYMQPPNGESMNFKIGKSSRATNIVQLEYNPTYTPIPSMTDHVPPHTHQFPP